MRRPTKQTNLYIPTNHREKGKDQLDEHGAFFLTSPFLLFTDYPYDNYRQTSNKVMNKVRTIVNLVLQLHFQARVDSSGFSWFLITYVLTDRLIYEFCHAHRWLEWTQRHLPLQKLRHISINEYGRYQQERERHTEEQNTTAQQTKNRKTEKQIREQLLYSKWFLENENKKTTAILRKICFTYCDDGMFTSSNKFTIHACETI